MVTFQNSLGTSTGNINRNIDSSKELLEQKVLDLLNKTNEQTLLFTQINKQTDKNLSKNFNDLIINVNNRSSQISNILGNIGDIVGMVQSVSKGLEKLSLGNDEIEESIQEGHQIILDSLKVLGHHLENPPTPVVTPSSKRKREVEEFGNVPLKRIESAPELEWYSL